MIHFNIQWIQLAVVAFANFILSWLWYSPVLFGKPFMKVLGIPEGHQMSEAEKKKMPLLMANGLFCSLLLSGALQVLCRSLGAVEFAQGAEIGILVWAGFALTGSLGTLWENRSMTLIKISNGLYLFSYAVFGGIVAVWR